MCGRFELTAPLADLHSHFMLRKAPRYQADYNICPGQKILAVVQLADSDYKGVNLHWGLIPSWSKDKKISSHLINARSETVQQKPSFRSAFKKRRCLIAATGFYEWQQNENGKQAYHITNVDHALFAFAGLWEHWDQGEETIYSCTIITTAANEIMLPIHQRMPVIVQPSDYETWLHSESDSQTLQTLLQQDTYADMQLKAVSAYVNNPAHNDKKCFS